MMNSAFCFSINCKQTFGVCWIFSSQFEGIQQCSVFQDPVSHQRCSQKKFENKVSLFYQRRNKNTLKGNLARFVSIVQHSDVDKVIESLTRTLGKRKRRKGQAVCPLPLERNVPKLKDKEPFRNKWVKHHTEFNNCFVMGSFTLKSFVNTIFTMHK